MHRAFRIGEGPQMSTSNEMTSREEQLQQLLTAHEAQRESLQARTRRFLPAVGVTVIAAVATIAAGIVLFITPPQIHHERVSAPLTCSPLSDQTVVDVSYMALEDTSEFMDAAEKTENNPFMFGVDYSELNVNCLHARDQRLAVLTVAVVAGATVILIALYWLAQCLTARRVLQRQTEIAEVNRLLRNDTDH